MRGLNHQIIEYISRLDDIDQYASAGSFRRYKEQSKDLDFIISTNHPEKVQQQLLDIPNKVKDVAIGSTKVSLELEYDDETIGVDFRLIEPVAFITHYNISQVQKIIIFVLDN